MAAILAALAYPANAQFVPGRIDHHGLQILCVLGAVLALARRPSRVLIVGAGLIGCEAASCCRDLGLTVTLVDPNPTPLARLLGTVIGATLAERMRASGVDLRPDTKVEALSGEGGHVRRAHLRSGQAVETDLVIVALGAIRDTGWLAAAGYSCDRLRARPAAA